MGDRGRGKVVLVVEDEAIIRMVLTDHLEECGYVVREAGDADDAIALLSNGADVDAVVTDVRMPGSIDGIGLAAWVYRHKTTMPVVIASGYITENEAKAANPQAVVLTKPYVAQDVVALLGALLN